MFAAARRFLRIDWLCQGCGRQGSLRWLRAHRCPKRDRIEAEVRQRWSGGSHFYRVGRP